MFGFDQVPDFSARDPEAMARAQQEHLARLRDLHERMSAVTGRAESDDRRVSVAFSESRGTHDLRIDPRVLRLPSEELAEMIERLVNSAREDAKKQAADVTQEILGDTMDPRRLLDNLPQMEASLGEMLKAAKESSNDVAAMAQRLMGSFSPPDSRSGG